MLRPYREGVQAGKFWAYNLFRYLLNIDNKAPFVILSALCLPLPALAITIVPTGLNAGDTYHLVFVTSTTRNATSTNIADYDAFVNNVADLASNAQLGDINWKVIGSTSSVDAVNHAVWKLFFCRIRIDR